MAMANKPTKAERLGKELSDILGAKQEREFEESNPTKRAGSLR
jgi:hypothetical protein